MDNVTTLQLAGDAQRNAERLTALGHPVPAALTAAFELRDSVDLAADPGPVTDALADATTKNASDKLTRWIEQRTRYETLQTHRADIDDTLNRRILLAHQQSAAEIFETCRDGFTKAAAEFAEAFAKMPDNWRDPNTLVRGGPAVVAQFQAAATAAGILDEYHAIRRATPGGNPLGQLPLGLEYADCSDSIVATEACRVRPGGPLGRWGDLLDLDGVTRLVWRTPAELAAAVRSLPVAEMRPVRAGIGVRLEKQVVRG